MKRITKLKSIIGYKQTNDVFRDYLNQLVDADIIEINDGDIVGQDVSDELYERVANVFGVQLDEELNPVEQEVEP